MAKAKLEIRQAVSEKGNTFLIYAYFDDKNNNYEYQTYKLVSSIGVAKEFGVSQTEPNRQSKLNAREMCKKLIMKIKTTQSLVLFLLCFFITSVNAQQLTTASGGDASGPGGTVAYSIGQLVYKTNTSSSGSVAQGVEQPYEISIVSGIESTNDLSIKLNAYPNPTIDCLTLFVENSELIMLNFHLFDVNGKLIETKNITKNKETINMVNLPNSTYFLKVFNNKIEIKTFKIIKN